MGSFPITGSPLYDGALAFLVLLNGLFLMVKYGNRTGMFLMAAALFWFYKVFGHNL